MNINYFCARASHSPSIIPFLYSPVIMAGLVLFSPLRACCGIYIYIPFWALSPHPYAPHCYKCIKFCLFIFILICGFVCTNPMECALHIKQINVSNFRTCGQWQWTGLWGQWLAETVSLLAINPFVFYFKFGLEPSQKRTESRENSFYKTSFQVWMDM